MPVPLNEKTKSAVSGSFELIVSVQDFEPSDIGAKVTVTVPLAPGVMVGEVVLLQYLDQAKFQMKKFRLVVPLPFLETCKPTP